LKRVAMVEATEDVAEAIMGDSGMATAMAFMRDMDTVGGVILTGGITLTIPIIMIIVCVGVLDTGVMTLILGKGCGYPGDGFHATKR